MRMNTEERLATITEMYPPTVTELLDIVASSHQKVPPSKSTSEYALIPDNTFRQYFN